ncbi:hypothetical protein OJF2_29300 [Aquisphaera giovannonii]|uniref:YdhG-like domain-containing protein n=1 Tax=Aquisphaera giovannonii TaxID=406548 RepID=A0A5B9W2S9_9BACT|nr:DUF1801 domain-containing protein [Aquisphaera giovannonii]QEH34391.1 hypothetical protein OJF2_29300 [Aquisphaera giovannonii]
MGDPRPATAAIDDYIASFPSEIRAILERVRSTIRDAAPGAEEAIRYRMPTFRWKGNLVHFAAFKHHIGLYPPVKGDAALRSDLERYAGEKGNLKFPLDEPIPYELIARVVRRRVQEQEEAAGAKGRRQR